MFDKSGVCSVYAFVTVKGLLCLLIYLQTLMSSFSKAASKEWIYLCNFSLLVVEGSTISV